MTDVLGHGPVAYYEQPLLITSIRPQSARSLPTTLQEQQFSESFELCIDAVSTATMDSLRSSYPTLAVTRSESDSTSPLQHIVAKLQLRREMQQHLREKPLHEHMRMHRRHKHAWKEKKTVELQKPVWQNGITTNEFAGGTKQAEYVVFPKTNGLRRGFWKSMSSPTPGEQNLKTQQKKQSAMYKRRYDPDKMNMSHVMKKLQLKSSHSAGEERKKPEAEGKDVARRSAPTTSREFVTTEKPPRENDEIPSANNLGYKTSANYRRRYHNMLMEKALADRALAGSNQRQRNKLPLLSISSDDDKEDTKREEDTSIDLKDLCKSARPITDITTSRKTARDDTKLHIQSLSLRQQDEKSVWPQDYQYHVQGDRDTVTTGRYATTSAIIKYDKQQTQPQQQTVKQGPFKKLETPNEQSVSVQLLKPFENVADDSYYQQTYKIGLRHQPPMMRQDLFNSEFDTTRTPTNTPAPLVDPAIQQQTQIDSNCVCGHQPILHDKNDNKKPYFLGNSRSKTSIEVYLPSVT